MLTVGDMFPAFKVQACVGREQADLRPITHNDDAGKWKIFFFYPKDFTFVCPTEIAEFGRKHREFLDRDCVVYGGSTDNEFCHLAWRRSHEDLRDLPFPLIAAPRLAADLGILEPSERVCLRATFIVDPHGVIQWAQANNLNVGRNVNEILRVLDAIQSDELCPCNWKKGDPYLTLEPVAVGA
jgi:peroxiredoxin (alkyl hydroperoxide reductase subunit C)